MHANKHAQRVCTRHTNAMCGQGLVDTNLECVCVCSTNDVIISHAWFVVAGAHVRDADMGARDALVWHCEPA